MKSLDCKLEVLVINKFIYGPGNIPVSSGFFPALWYIQWKYFLNIDALHGLWPVQNMIKGSGDRENFEASSTSCQGT